MIVLFVHCGPPWHCWQFAEVNSARPAIASGSVLVKGEMGARMPNCSNAMKHYAARNRGERSQKLSRTPVNGAVSFSLQVSYSAYV